MANSNDLGDSLPTANYVALRLPDGRHSGVRWDAARGVLEVQKQGVRYYFDLALAVAEQTCYTNRQEKN